jgi:hypothetical protein
MDASAWTVYKGPKVIEYHVYGKAAYPCEHLLDNSSTAQQPRAKYSVEQDRLGSLASNLFIGGARGDGT